LVKSFWRCWRPRPIEETLSPSSTLPTARSLRWWWRAGRSSFAICRDARLTTAQNSGCRLHTRLSGAEDGTSKGRSTRCSVRRAGCPTTLHARLEILLRGEGIVNSQLSVSKKPAHAAAGEMQQQQQRQKGRAKCARLRRLGSRKEGSGRKGGGVAALAALHCLQRPWLLLGGRIRGRRQGKRCH